MGDVAAKPLPCPFLPMQLSFVAGIGKHAAAFHNVFIFLERLRTLHQAVLAF